MNHPDIFDRRTREDNSFKKLSQAGNTMKITRDGFTQSMILYMYCKVKRVVLSDKSADAINLVPMLLVAVAYCVYDKSVDAINLVSIRFSSFKWYCPLWVIGPQPLLNSMEKQKCHEKK